MKRLLIAILFLMSGSASATTWTYTEFGSGPDILALGYPVPLPIDSLTPVDGFRSYASLHARHQDLMLLSDNITGQIVGQTSYGRDIWAYILSDADNVLDDNSRIEGAALQNGGIHAREWASPEVTTAIIERFAEFENDNGIHQYLLQNMNMVIIPVLNIDGFLQTQRFPNQALQSAYEPDPSTWPRDGRMRRKNMVNVDEVLSTENDALNGIDLNRNNDPYWATSNRSSFDVGSLVHHGSGPGSESESQALYAAAELGPANRLRFYVDTHSYSKLWFQPNTNNSRRNAIATRVGQAMQVATGNTYGLSPSTSGAGIGSTDEYFAVTYQIPSYTLEIEPGSGAGTEYGGFGVSHSGFVLPESEVARVRNELTNASVIAWYMQSDPAHVVAVEIRRISDDTVVFAGNWQSVDDTTRQWQETVNLGLVRDTEYSIWVAYNKPMTWLDETGQSVPFNSQTQPSSPGFELEGIAASGDGFDAYYSGQFSDWLTEPGGASLGYLRYKADAFMFNFTIGTEIDPANASLLALAFENRDAAQMLADADPSTKAGYSIFWNRYEETSGAESDFGGIDRTVRIVNDGSPGFIDPSTVTVTPPPPPPPAPEPNNSSGGGSMGWPSLIMAFLLILVRRLGYPMRTLLWKEPC